MQRKLPTLVRSGFYKEALSFFTNLHSQSQPLSKFTFPFLLKSCSKLQLISHGEMLHSHLTKTGFNSDIYTATSLTDMYMKFQFLDSALKVFDEMPEPNTTLINVVLSGFSQNGYNKESFDVFRRFGEYRIRPDSVTVASLLSGCNVSVKDGQQVHSWAVKIGVETDIYVATSLVTMYFNCKQPLTASTVFERIVRKTVACCNAFCTSLLQNRAPERVFEVFKEMLNGLNGSVEKPNRITFVSVLSACAACSGLTGLKPGRQVHGLLVKARFVRDLLVGTALLDMYAKCGYWHWAYDVFQELSDIRSLITWNSMISGMMLNRECENAIGLFNMLESGPLRPDSATWNIMINGLANLGKPEEAFVFFKKMQARGEPVSMKSLTSLLSVCASVSSVTSGKEIHCYTIRTGIIKDEFVATAVINMYMKCGRPSSAFLVFDRFEVKPRDPVIWNAMISGYGRNGDNKAAFDTFDRMQTENVKPNLTTFNCLLTVCSHTGELEKGLEFLRLMNRYNLVPTYDHYACVVDLLGRSGKIEEARGLLLTMPEISGSVVDSLIGACGFHSDVKTGEEMGRMLGDLDPKNPTRFVVLSNIYAGSGRWKEVEDLREEMDRRGLKKISGFSSLSSR